MKSIMGLIIPKEGNIVFDGKNIIGLKPHEIARLGIGLVPEDRRIFPEPDGAGKFESPGQSEKRGGVEFKKDL